MIKLRKRIKDDEVPLIDKLDAESLEVINNLLLKLDPKRRPYTSKLVRKDIRIRRAEQESGYYKELMEERKAVSQ